MLDQGTFIPCQAGQVAVPVLNYSFTRRFGVEIEAYNCTQEKLLHELREAGIRVASKATPIARRSIGNWLLTAV